MEHLFSIGSQGQGSTNPQASAASAFMDPAMRQQADSLWKMLDEMAESDPSAYAQFIQNQAKTAADAAQAEEAARPKAVGAVVLALAASGTVAIHIWPSPGSQVPMARVKLGQVTASTADWSELQIPTAKVLPPGAWRPSEEHQECCTHLHCTVNQNCLFLAGTPSLVVFRSLLHEAVCQWAEVTWNLKLQRIPRSMQVAERYLLKQKEAGVPKPKEIVTTAGDHGTEATSLATLLPTSTKKTKSPLIQVLN